jgi:pSer/pThr/pTyr-binding forkhead associated (FHA) protein
MESHETGTLPGTGSFRCTACDYTVTLAAWDRLPRCPACGSTDYARASFFTDATADPPASTADDDAGWLAEIREGLDEPGQYLAYDDGPRVRVFALGREWTRIGRSLAADVRFDDPTVSRRHALLVRGPDGVRILDDRSLNGVFVNGERVEWSTLADGDEILVGRHALRFIEVSPVSSLREGAREEGESGAVLPGRG